MTVYDDTFTRANSSTTLGSTEANSGTTGTTAWTVSSGTWGIISNKAYRTGTASQHEQATVDTGSTDHEVYADLIGAGGEYLGLVARFVDTSNHYILQAQIGAAATLYAKVGGTFTSLGTASGGNATSGERWGLRCNGTVITVYRAGSSVLSVTNSALSTGTRVGLNNFDATTTANHDNFHGNTLSGGADTTPPSVVTRVVNASLLTITYDESLSTVFVPVLTAYTVKVNSVARAITNVSVSGTTVVLTLTTPVISSDTVTLTYSP